MAVVSQGAALTSALVGIAVAVFLTFGVMTLLAILTIARATDGWLVLLTALGVYVWQILGLTSGASALMKEPWADSTGFVLGVTVPVFGWLVGLARGVTRARITVDAREVGRHVARD